MVNSEKIMVCVYYGPNGERLIRRGSQLAKLLHCTLVVLSVIPVHADELDQEQEHYMAQWQKICEEAGAAFIVKSSENRKSSEIIAETAKHHQITQLIIGQPGQTRWQEIMQGSFVNELLNHISGIDVHIVAVQRMDVQETESHEPGVRVSVISSEGEYYISSAESEEEEPVAEGIFFKDLNTDFDTGLLKIKLHQEFKYLRVIRGKIADPSPFQPDS